MRVTFDLRPLSLYDEKPLQSAWYASPPEDTPQLEGRCHHRLPAWRTMVPSKTGFPPNEEDKLSTIFGKIIKREMPAGIVYEDDLCLAFRDINPQAPIHVLVVPKQEIARLSDTKQQDQMLLGHLLLVANKVARELGVQDAFRVVVNNGSGAGQSVFHLHLHVLGGRPFRWPPG
jgi:histidine triad (HIT) family protein